MAEARLQPVQKWSGICVERPTWCEAGRPWGRECTFLSLHSAAGRVGRGSLWSVCHMKVADFLFLSLLCLPLFSHHQDEQWLIITYLLGFIYMAPPMDRGAWFYIYTRIYGAFQGFPGGSDGKASACNVGDPGSISGFGRSPRKGNGNPL